MKKKENSSHKTFNLDDDVSLLIREGSNMNDMTQSEFIEFLVNAWDENVNPLKNLKRIRTNKKLLSDDIKELENKENIIMENMEKVEEWRKLKQEKRPQVVQTLVRLINHKDNYQAEVFAKNESVRLGIPATQLIFEAMDQIKNKGV